MHQSWELPEVFSRHWYLTRDRRVFSRITIVWYKGTKVRCNMEVLARCGDIFYRTLRGWWCSRWSNIGAEGTKRIRSIRTIQSNSTERIKRFRSCYFRHGSIHIGRCPRTWWWWKCCSKDWFFCKKINIALQYFLNKYECHVLWLIDQRITWLPKNIQEKLKNLFARNKQ